MFRFICKKLLASKPSGSSIIVCNNVLPIFPHSSLTTISEASHSPTVSDLTNIIGLSSKSALSLSKKIRTESLKDPDSVIQVLKDYGCDDEHISAIVTKGPAVLSFNAENNLRPKLEFLRAAGFTDPEIADILSVNPSILSKSLDRKITKSVNFLKSILPSMAAVSDVLKSTNQMLLPLRQANIEILRNCGVHESSILSLLAQQPRSLNRSADEFAGTVEKVKEMGLEPASPIFSRAVGVMSYTSKSTWERKLVLYRSLGWSDNEIISMFTRQPHFIGIADETIKEKLSFFSSKLGWDSAFLYKRPVLLLLSIQKRIIPRCSVLNVLMSKGLVKDLSRSAAPFVVSERIFSCRYMKKYESQLPEVLEAYKGKLRFDGWDTTGCKETVGTRQL